MAGDNTDEQLSGVEFDTFPTLPVQPGTSDVIPLEISPKSSALTTVFRCHVELCDPATSSGAIEDQESNRGCGGGSGYGDNLYQKVNFEVSVK